MRNQAVTIGKAMTFNKWRAEFMRQSLWEMDAREDGSQGLFYGNLHLSIITCVSVT